MEDDHHNLKLAPLRPPPPTFLFVAFLSFPLAFSVLSFSSCSCEKNAADDLSALSIDFLSTAFAAATFTSFFCFSLEKEKKIGIILRCCKFLEYSKNCL